MPRKPRGAAGQKSPAADRAPDSLDHSSGFLWPALACATIVLATLAAYSGSFRGPFIFDDVFFVEQPTAEKLWPIWPALAGPRPVIQVTLALNYCLAGGSATDGHAIGPAARSLHSEGSVPIGYHVFNVAVHLLAALTLFGVIRRTLIQCRLPGSACAPLLIAECRVMTEKDPSNAKNSGQFNNSVRSAVIPQHSAFGNRQSAIACFLAFCAALLWALHPLQTEAVTYVIQRMESLMGLFYLLTLYCFIRATEVSTTETHGNARLRNTEETSCRTVRLRAFPWLNRPSPWWSAAAVAACALGMGCKEVMASAPLLVLLYDRTFVGGSFKEALRRRWRLYLALAATWLIVAPAALTALAPAATQSAGFNIAGVSSAQYARSEFGVILHYLQLAFWPAGLCLDYDWPIANGLKDILPGAIAVGALLGATVWAMVRAPKPGFIGAWFFLILAPTSSVMPFVDLASEHRMYLPLAAVITAVVIAAYLIGRRMALRLPGTDRARRLLALAAATALISSSAAALGAATWLRNADYRTAISILQDNALKRPKNPRVWGNLGHVCLVAGRDKMALSASDKAIELNRDYAGAWNNRGTALADLGRFDDAIASFEKAVACQRDYPEAYENLYNVCLHTRQFSRALAACDREIAETPDHLRAWFRRGIIHSMLGDAAAAVEDFRKVIALNPRYAEAYYNMAAAYSNMRRPKDALDNYDQTIKLKPDFAPAWHGRGLIYAGEGHDAEALRDCAKAIALKPDFSAARKTRAMLYFKMGEFDKSWADVKRCEELRDPPPADFLKALEAAAPRPK